MKLFRGSIVVIIIVLVSLVFLFILNNNKKETFIVMIPISGDIFVLDNLDNQESALIDVSKGKILTHQKYNNIDCKMYEKYCVTELNNKYGLININGDVIFDNTYDYIDSFHKVDGMYIAVKNNKEFIIDDTGKIVLNSLGDDVKIVKIISSDYIIVTKNEQYGIIDIEGNSVINYLSKNIKIDDIDESTGIAYLSDDTKKVYGFINLKDDLIVKPIYENKLSFSEDISPAKLGGKYGYINSKNQKIIDYMYEKANQFSERLASVQLNGKFGYIDKLGKVIIDYQYDDAKPFNNGVAYVAFGTWNENKGYSYFSSEVDYFINKNNEKITPIHNSSHNLIHDYHYITSSASKNRYYITKNGDVYYYNQYEDYGFTINMTRNIGTKIMNQEGDTILEKRFTDIIYPNSTTFCIYDDNLWECYNNHGEKLYEYQKNLNHSVYYFDTVYNVFKNDKTVYLYDDLRQLIYKTKKDEYNLLVSKSNNYIVYTKDNQVISYNLKTKERKTIYKTKHDIFNYVF